MDNFSDEENDCRTSDYFSESTPKSCKSFDLDHKYALSPNNSITKCLSISSDKLTPNNSNTNSKLIKKQKQFKRRKLFDDQNEGNKRDNNLTPLSERQQLAIALQLSSHESECSSHNTYNTNNGFLSTNTPLRSGVQRVKRNHKGETSLHIAAIKGDLNRVKQIIADNKYPIDCTDFAGWSAIHEACNRGHIPIVEALLKAGSNVNARGYNNDTPLIDAAVNGHYNLVKLLLKYGADYTLKNNYNKSVVEVTKSVRVLEEIYSFINEKMPKNGVNSKDNARPQTSPSNNFPLKPSSPRLTLRFQSIKDTKQTTCATITTVSGPTMASTKSYSVSNASDKEMSTESIDKQNENNIKSTSNGSTPESVSASSDHNYTSVDSSLTTTADDSSRGRKRRKSNDGSISSTSTGGPSPRSGSSSSNTSIQSSNYNNKKHQNHNQSPHHSHHHHVNHSNKSKDNTKDKNTKKSFSSSSDSDGIENSECDKESNSKDNTSNGTSNVGSTESSAPKVPPLRIVLPANTSNTTSSLNASTASISGPHSSLTSNVTSSTSSSGAKFPYVVPSEESFQSESEGVSGAVSSQRITRSSQRVAQQQSQKSNNSVEHHSDSEESALHNSHTDSQHPRKRKIRNNNNNNNTNENKGVANNVSNTSNGDNDNDSSSSTSSIHLIPKDVSPFALPQTNCYQMFLSIRKNVDKKRKEMFSVPPKAPQGFDDYLINRCSYMLANNNKESIRSSVCAPTLAKPTLSEAPTTLSGSRMHEVFVEQEKERYKLKIQHLIERQKLVLSSEQETLRVHGRAARAMANQSVPFSVCSILKDEEIYNIFDSETEQNDNISNQLKTEKGLTAGTTGLSANRTRYNGRLFFSWLQDVSDKWEKTKKVMLLRHRKESESLLAMQRLEWEWKLKQFGLCDQKNSPHIDEKHVPKVFVSDNFELPV